MTETIHFFSEGVKFSLQERTTIRKWINEIIRSGGKESGPVNFIFCGDDQLLEINIKYLNHSTLTDIVTFPYSEENEFVSGDIYISIDRVKENAGKYGVSFETELDRVMIHGVLHLLGMEDGTTAGKKRMRSREDECLARLNVLENKKVPRGTLADDKV